MQGWLVVNAFYKNGKLNDIYDMLERSCAKFGMRLDVRTTADILLPFGAKPTTLPDFVIFGTKMSFAHACWKRQACPYSTTHKQ